MLEKPPQVRGRVLVVAACSVAVLFIAVAYQLGIGASQEPVLAEVVSIAEGASGDRAVPTSDTDGDGALDWQELLFGSNPADKEDVPTSENFAFSIIATSSTSSSTTVLTPTDELARRLVQEYVQVAGEAPLDQNKATLIGEKLASSIYTSTPYDPYAAADIQTTPDTSYQAVLAYRADMQRVLEPMISLPEPEFALYGRIVESGDQEAVQEMLRVADIYEAVAADLTTVTVPEDAVQYHLNATNSLGYFAEVLRDLVRYINDPIASFALLRAYNDAEAYVVNSFNTLSTYYVLKHNSYDEQ